MIKKIEICRFFLLLLSLFEFIIIFQPFVPWPLHFHWLEFGIPGNVAISVDSFSSIFPYNSLHMFPGRKKCVGISHLRINEWILRLKLEFIHI